MFRTKFLLQVLSSSQQCHWEQGKRGLRSRGVRAVHQHGWSPGPTVGEGTPSLVSLASWGHSIPAPPPLTNLGTSGSEPQLPRP